MRCACLLFFLGLLVLACDPQDTSALPPCLETPSKAIHTNMKRAIQIAIPPYLQAYQYTNEGQLEEKDELWNNIFETGKQSYAQVSVTNIFEEGGETEYYVLEQMIDLKDTSQRQPVIEYQFVVNSDTAILNRVDERELRYTGISMEGAYLLEGYAHKDNLEPEQLRWWSPTSGDLLIWYGDTRFLRLVSPLSPTQQDLIQKLIQYFS